VILTISMRGRVRLSHRCGILVCLSVLAARILAADAAVPASVQSPGLDLNEAADPRPDFVHDVAPLLSRFGCNGSACHGKAEGMNGFKLSVFGNDPLADHDAITRQSRSRRITPAAPDASLMLRKAAGDVPHAGGVRMKPDSREYSVLRAWIASGATYAAKDRSEITRLHVEPEQKVMGFEQTQPLRVMAEHADGTKADVTWLATFHSNNPVIAEVDESGGVKTGSSIGLAAVMARYAGNIAIFQATLPRPGPQVAGTDEKGFNAIDDLVQANLRRMNLRASGLADDAEFLRRVYLDVAGRLPSADEAREFLGSTSDGKRERLVETLLDLPEYADFWAQKWSDLLRVDRLALGAPNAFAYYSWIHEAVAQNRPLDIFARDLLLAEGPLTEQPAGYFLKASKKSGELAATVSQVFLGIRITCAECHQHPYDRWTQGDYHGMRAFFEQVKYKKLGGTTAEDVVEALVVEGSPEVKHPRTKQVIHAHALGTAMPEKAPEGDRRVALAAWLTASDNPWFARNLANRFWAHFFGRGLVEPVDDVRATNPPSNPELLDALARKFVESRFDAKEMIRFITASRAYQVASKPNQTNEADAQNFSRALFRRMPAETLLDAVCGVTGVSEKFTGVPEGTRAVQLWDSQQQHYFLKLFGRPQRITPCECERATGASIAQALHLMNAPGIQAKLTHRGGSIERWAAMQDDARMIEDVYLTCLARIPDSAEKNTAREYLTSHPTKRRQAVEDLVWSLLNSLEFVFNH